MNSNVDPSPIGISVRWQGMRAGGLMGHMGIKYVMSTYRLTSMQADVDANRETVT